MMYQDNIRKVLRQHGCKVWKLCDVLGISRSHYYDLSHHDFKGHEKAIKDGLKKVIADADKKAGAVHAD